MKLLVVEDDRTVGQYVKRGLEEQQYIADLVTDGTEALRVASTVPYDLIILDPRLPGMTGIESGKAQHVVAVRTFFCCYSVASTEA